MAKTSSSYRYMTRYFHQIAAKPSTSSNPTSYGMSQFITQNPKIIQNPISSSWLSNTQRTHFPSSPNISGIFCKLDPHAKSLSNRNFIGFRYFSIKNYENGSKSLSKKVVKRPSLSLKNVSARYKAAVGLQIESFWKRNYLVILGAGGIVVCIVLWRVLFGIATTFIGFSEGMAKYGFLAFSSSIVAFTGMYLRSRFTINPDRVYRMAMRKLNTSANILEVMGAPLTGTDLRAYVMSGGGISIKNFEPGLRSKRCFLIFPIHGSERKGLVSVEVKKKKGQYDMKLLAVDVPVASGPDQRMFLIGDEEEYRVGDGLISELRDPVVKALAAAKEFEARDEKEDKEDEEAERAAQEEESRVAQEEYERAAREEEERVAREEEERAAREEAERAEREDAERAARQEAERAAYEEAEKAEHQESETESQEEPGKLEKGKSWFGSVYKIFGRKRD